MPVERVGQNATEKHSDASATGGDEPDHPHRLRAFGRFGEEDHDQRESDGGHHGSADALDRPGADEELLRPRDTAGEGCRGEQGDADEEQPAVAEQVTEPATEQQEASEREQVRVHHPGERSLGEAEVLPDRRQRHVHDRRVQDDHQIPEAQYEQGQPPGSAVHGHELIPLAAFACFTTIQTAPPGRTHRYAAGPARRALDAAGRR